MTLFGRHRDTIVIFVTFQDEVQLQEKKTQKSSGKIFSFNGDMSKLGGENETYNGKSIIGYWFKVSLFTIQFTHFIPKCTMKHLNCHVVKLCKKSRERKLRLIQKRKSRVVHTKKKKKISWFPALP